MKLPEGLSDLLVTNIVPLALKLASGAIPEASYKEFFAELGRKSSKALRKGLGSAGESVETFTQKYANMAVDAFNAGADEDDQIA